MLAGIATQSAVRMRGGVLRSVFCSEKAVPKPPRQTSEKNSIGDFPIATKNNENKNAEHIRANAGTTTASAQWRHRKLRLREIVSSESVPRLKVALPPDLQNGELAGARRERRQIAMPPWRLQCLQVTEPITPSTR